MWFKTKASYSETHCACQSEAPLGTTKKCDVTGDVIRVYTETVIQFGILNYK